MLQLAEAVAAAAGIRPSVFEPAFKPARSGELVRSCLDIRRAQHDLRLPPPVPLTDGLRHTVNWMRSR